MLFTQITIHLLSASYCAIHSCCGAKLASQPKCHNNKLAKPNTKHQMISNWNSSEVRKFAKPLATNYRMWCSILQVIKTALPSAINNIFQRVSVCAKYTVMSVFFILVFHKINKQFLFMIIIKFKTTKTKIYKVAILT